MRVATRSRIRTDAAVPASCEVGIFGSVTLQHRPDGRVAAHAHASVPYLGVFLWPVLVAALRRVADDVAAGRAPASRPAPIWLPPSSPSAASVPVLCTVAALVTVVGFCSTLATLTSAAWSATFHLDAAATSSVFALTRVGALVVLGLAVLTDRVGRRRIALWSVGGLAAVSIATAAAPGVVVFVTAQTLARGLVNVAAVATVVLLLEEAPEGARAWMVAAAGLASGVGVAAANLTLPLLDLAAWTWRIPFALPVIALACLPGVARRLPESARFDALVARQARTGRLRELVDAAYRRRLVLLGVAVFALNVAAAPTSQLLVKYLQDERGWTATGVLGLRALTQGIPPVIAVLVGGRLAERRGRIPMATFGTLVAALADAVLFLTGGIPMVTALMLASVGTALAGPSWGALGGELFPTEVRGAGNAALVVAGVSGAMCGLALTAVLTGSGWQLGPAVAVTDIAAVLAAVLLVPRLPETAGRDLDDVSPPEV